MTQCDICQVSNEDSALFCRECGGRLPGRDLTPPATAEQRPEPPKRPKLHSPILGGADPEADDSYAEPAPGPAPRSQSKTGGKKGLRSPLLGGDAGEDDEPQPNFSRGSKGGLRSPMLGGGGGGGGKSSGKHDIEFPHRSHQDLDADELPGAPSPTQKPHKGLRSPLLGGDDGDFEEMPAIGNTKSHGTSKSHRLRSPILGGGGADEYLDEEVFEEDDELHEDPTALRSPLLAVRAPKTEKPRAAEPIVAPQPAAPAMPGAQPTPQPLPQPLPQPVSQPVSQPVPQPMPPQPPVQAPPAPAQQYGYASPNQIGQPLPSPSASQAQMPALPQVPPRFQPQPAPSPSSSHYQLSQQTLVNLTPAQQNQPAAQSANPNSAQEQVSDQAQAATPVKPQPAPSAPSQTPEPKPVLRSKLLGDADDALPADRRGNDRRSGPRTGGRRSLDFSEDTEPLYQPQAPSSAPNPAAPLVMATAAFALLIKFWYIGANLQFFMSSLPAGVDQVASIAVLVALIMFGMKASERT